MRDAVRTAATWAGAADAAADEAVRLLATRPEPTELERLAAGRIRAEQGTIGLWLAEGGRRRRRRHPAARGRRVPAARRSLPRRRACSTRRRAPAARTRSRPAAALDRARRDLELFMLQHRLDPHRRARRRSRARGGPVSVDPATFERMYREDEDPWGFGTSAYEAAKYDRTIAALGDRRFHRALELGCSIGVLTARLAERCDELIALDTSATAVERARERVGARRGPACRDAARGAAGRALRPRRRQRGPLLLRARGPRRAARRPRGRAGARRIAARRPLAAADADVPAARRRGPRDPRRATGAARGSTPSPTTATGSTSSSGRDAIRSSSSAAVRPPSRPRAATATPGVAPASCSSPTTTARPTGGRR